MGRSAFGAVAGVAALLAAPTANATYTAGTPLDTAGSSPNAASVAVNQSSRDVYVGVVGATLFVEKGKVFRFDSAGSAIACAPNTPAPSFPGGVAANPKNGDLFVLDTAANKNNSKIRVYGGSGCGSDAWTREDRLRQQAALYSRQPP